MKTQQTTNKEEATEVTEAEITSEFLKETNTMVDQMISIAKKYEKKTFIFMAIDKDVIIDEDGDEDISVQILGGAAGSVSSIAELLHKQGMSNINLKRAIQMAAAKFQSTTKVDELMDLIKEMIH